MTSREVTPEIDAARDQLAREHKRARQRGSYAGAAQPWLAWEALSAVDRGALTEMLLDKIIIERHPSQIDKDGRRHYRLIRAFCTEILGKRLSSSRWCMRLGARSSPESEQWVGHRGGMHLKDAQQGPPHGMYAMVRIAFSGMLFRP